MTASAGCQLIGRWQIFEADIWDRDDLDLVEPAYLEIGKDGRGEFAFGFVNATMEVEYSRSIVFFRWTRFDEGDEISGEGSAELQDDGTVEIELSFDAATRRSSRRAASELFNSQLVDRIQHLVPSFDGAVLAGLASLLWNLF
jgi:hypothetical protein